MLVAIGIQLRVMPKVSTAMFFDGGGWLVGAVTYIPTYVLATHPHCNKNLISPAASWFLCVQILLHQLCECFCYRSGFVKDILHLLFIVSHLQLVCLQKHHSYWGMMKFSKQQLQCIIATSALLSAFKILLDHYNLYVLQSSCRVPHSRVWLLKGGFNGNLCPAIATSARTVQLDHPHAS